MCGDEMDLNTAIKNIVQDYLRNHQSADLIYGIWKGTSVQLDNKSLSVPLDMIDVPKHLTVAIGNRVILFQKQGGQRFALLGVLS